LETIFHKMFSAVLTILTGVILGWAVISALYYRMLG
jgi:hypothetical protein